MKGKYLLLNIYLNTENGKRVKCSIICRQEDPRSIKRPLQLLLIGCLANYKAFMLQDQALDPTSVLNASHSQSFWETDWDTLSLIKRWLKSLRTRKDWSRLTTKSEEIPDSHSVSWTLFQLKELESTSDFSMTWREDTKLTKSMRKKLSSSSARSSKRQWESTRSHTWLPMMEEPSGSLTQISRRTILSR